jgi:V/A-type H+/Na+-transporting ATPase subunit D
MSTIRVPPGRTGRLWLRHRLDTASRGAALLEQKVRGLRDEQSRLAQRARCSGEEWAKQAQEAQSWLLRAALVGGQPAIRLAGMNEPAAVTITWTTAMGVRYPSDAVCTLPPADSPSLPGSMAIIRAAQAHRLALDVAVRHAVAIAAERVVGAEVTATSHRVRSLRQHWIPRLQEALARAELELEEQERAEGVRHRWAAQQQEGKDLGR